MPEKVKSKVDCGKADCVYFDTCKVDVVKTFLCGDTNKQYQTSGSILGLQCDKEFNSELKNLQTITFDQLKSIGDELDCKFKTGWSVDQYRVILSYKLQENLRHKLGQKTPEHITERIQELLNGRGITLELATYKRMGNEAIQQRLHEQGKIKRDPSLPKMGDLCRSCINEGMSFAETAIEVSKIYPDKRHKENYHAWYINDMKKRKVYNPKQR